MNLHAFQNFKDFKAGESGTPLDPFNHYTVLMWFLKTLQCLTVFDIEPRDLPRSPKMLERVERFVTI